MSTRFPRPALVVLLVGALAGPGRAAPARAAGERPNLVVIVADDLGWGDLASHGAQIATPHLDRLAREGLELARFYAAPTCTPARAALLTGRSPMGLGLARGALRPWSRAGLDPRVTILPEPLREAGYQTWMVGKWHLGHARAEHRPLERGFERFYGHLTGRVGYYDHRRAGGLDWQRDGVSAVEEGYATDLQAAEAVRRIRERDEARPFFLLLSFSAPHRPLNAPPEGVDERVEDRDRAVYRAMVENLDRGVGRVLAELDAHELGTETLVLFLSDNGGVEPASNAPLRGTKGTVYEGGVRVPCFVRWRGVIAAGSRSEEPFSVLDVLPTLLRAADVPLDGRREGLDGVDRTALWRDGAQAQPAGRVLHFVAESAAELQLAALRWPHKLVRIEPRPDGEAREALYDVRADPSEERDLAADQPELVLELRGALERWRALEPPDALGLGTGRPPPGWKAPERYAEALVR